MRNVRYKYSKRIEGEKTMQKKVTVVGAGNVGATVAQRLAEKELADVALIDIVEGLPQGRALDLQEAAPIEKHDARVIGANTYEASEGSDLIIITAGLPRKPGMGRGDLLATNAKIVKSVIEQVAPLSSHAILIIVTNPLDAMCHVAFQASKFPKNRVLGMAGVLDAARFRAFIAAELNVSVENTHTFVLGGHGRTMVPLPRYSTVAGIPITELLPPDRIEAIVERTRWGGAEIVDLLKTGSAYFAPASAVVEMAESILKDKKKILPCAAYLQGEYGIHDLFIGVPVKLGKSGVEEIIEVSLTNDEHAALQKSADFVQSFVESLITMDL
jgi:malate dehydrogenase